MTRSKIISLLLSIVMLISILPLHTLAADNDKTLRSVYLHAQGDNPQVTTNNSTVYMGYSSGVTFLERGMTNRSRGFAGVCLWVE